MKSRRATTGIIIGKSTIRRMSTPVVAIPGTTPSHFRRHRRMQGIAMNEFGDGVRISLSLLRPSKRLLELQCELSIPRIPRRPRKRDGVADVGEARDVGERALEPQAEARVRHRAVAAEIPVPGVVLLVDGAFGHAGVEHVEALLALTTADDLANPGREYIHGGDRPAVVVYPHVERLDVLRVVHHDDGLLDVLFGEIALVLRLQVDAPLDRELELLLRPLKHRDGLAVLHAHE